MKQKYHLISSIVSMCLTSILLVFIVMAWYVTNTTASVTGVTGSTAMIEEDNESMVVSVEYYYIESIEGNTYTIGESISGLSSNFELKSYNALSDNPHQILLKIKLNQDNLSINAKITESKVDEDLKETVEGTTKYIYLGAVNNNNKPIKEIMHKGNQLSSIISFYYITDVENNQFTIPNNQNEVSFVQEEGESYNKYLNDNLTLCENTGTSDTVYIMFDYVEGAIEDIYSINLGSEQLNPSEDLSDEHWMDVEYVCDFKISLSKASGGDE